MHLPHTDFRGGDLQAAQLGAQNPVHTNNNAECCVQCCRTPGCVYWTRTEAGECWLKGPTAVKTAAPGLNLVSGVASAAGCVNTASSNNVNAVAGAGISVDEYASSASRGNRCEITVPEPVHILQRRQALSDAPATTLLQPSLTTTDWTSQHPIGNGHFGALVGGNIRTEIIPVSVAGFYVRKAHVDEAPGERGQQPPDASLFAEAREDLKNNNIKEADKKMSTFIKKNLATFQYLFDMALVYSPVEMVWVEPANVGASAGGSGKGNKKAPPHRPRNIMLPTSREALLRTMYDHIDYKTPGHDVDTEQSDATKGATGAAGGVNHNANIVRPPFGDVLVSDGILDMRYGVAYNSFVEHVGTSGAATRSNTMHTTRENNSTKNGDSTDGAKSSVRLHHREWFASSVDNVMVGTISCKNTAMNHHAHPSNNANTKANDNGSAVYIDNALDSTACVHAALQLHRDSDLSLMPAVSIQSAPIYVDHSEYAWRLHTKDETDDTDDFVDNKMFAEIKAYRFDVTLVSTPDVTVPATAISGVVLCSQHINPASAKHSTPSNPPMTFTQHSYFDGSDPVLLCNHAHKMHIILSVESNGNIFESPVPPPEGANDYSAADVSATMLKKARKNVQKALKKGLVALRREHMQRFNNTMSKVNIALAGTSTATSITNTKKSIQYSTSAVNNLQHRIESVDSGCLHSNAAKSPHDMNQGSDLTITSQNTGTIDAALLSSLFQYGRYLLYSSGSNSMVNLQGLWADGPTSAWNGDYHLNINVQMSYWAADAVRVHEAMTPFNNFIQQLQTKGSVVAREMYGTADPQGWVAHGFTDGYMDPSLYGENQWALCVSCGAWAALQQWEHLLYTTNTGNVCGGKDTTRVGDEANIDDIVRVLETLRGVILFFKEYMFRIDGTDIIDGTTVGSTDNYTIHTGPTTSPENSYILLMTGDATDSGNAQVPAHLSARQQARAAHRKPYEVHSLTFSPSIDISVLRQVANAFTLTVQHAQHTVRKNDFKQLRDHCKKINEEETFDKKLDELTQKLLEDGKLAAEFVEMVAHMPGGGQPIIDTMLHDPEHQVALHLAKAAQKTQLAAQQQALLAQKNKENKASGKENGNDSQKDGAIPGPGASLKSVPDLFESNPAHLHPPVLPVLPAPVEHARKLSARFTPPVMDLPLPLPDYQLYVREYLHPHSLTKTKATDSNTDYVQGQNKMASDSLTRETVFSEDLDPGHRHFSGLHWLYPNTFLPYLPDYTPQTPEDSRKKKVTNNNNANTGATQKDDKYLTLKRAAYNTLRTKTERGGGHTGWSATWEAALYARLHQPTMALDALTKLVTRYLAPNLLCLHPPLEALNDVQCSTCFNESPGLAYDRQSKKDLHKRDTIKRINAEKVGEMAPVLTAQELNNLQDATLMPRGMVTVQPFSSKFQIDGNLGYLAALTEML
eukprot:gene11336-13183_t